MPSSSSSSEPSIKRKGSRLLSRLKRRSGSGARGFGSSNSNSHDRDHNDGNDLKDRESIPSSTSGGKVNKKSKSKPSSSLHSKSSTLSRNSAKSESQGSVSTKESDDNELYHSALAESSNISSNGDTDTTTRNIANQSMDRNTLTILESIRAAGVDSPKDVESLEYSPLTKEYVGKSRRNRKKRHSEPNPQRTHSYDNRNSSTALAQLVAKGIRPSSFQQQVGRLSSKSHHNRSTSSGSSVVWRAKSDQVDDSSSSVSSLSSSLQALEEEKAKNATKASTSTAGTAAAATSITSPASWREDSGTVVEVKSEDETEESDDGILHIGMASQVDKPCLDVRQDDPWYTERTFLGKQGEEGDEIHVGEMIVKNKFTGFIDWALGWNGHSETTGTKLTIKDRVQKRDQEASNDFAWCLGMITGAI